MEFYRNGEIPSDFVQDNVSCSRQGVVRGLHYQLKCPQAKLVSVLNGSILDVAVDIRRSSPSFGKFVVRILTAENGFQLFIPVGFAHGFQALSENTVVHYKCSDFYRPDDAKGIAFDDAELGIPWHWSEGQTVVSKADRSNPSFGDAQLPD
jgi:dTDP-4-dehydrorhamnose 3,5-epimerase